VAISKADKAIEYVDYAKHCLNIAQMIPDREARIVLREMAAEWANLAGQAAGEEASGAQTIGLAKRPAAARS
jgi:hypothetical protein